MNIKHRIWQAAKQNLTTIVMAASNIGLAIPCDSEQDYERVLCEINRMKENPIDIVTVPPLKPTPQIPVTQHDYRQRYFEAHEMNFKREYPAAFKDGFYSKPNLPKVATSNGLTTFIINYLSWLGYRATRINVTGRLVEQPEKQDSGIYLATKKYIHSATRKGTADISSTIRGRSVQWEVKVGKDRPSDKQIKEQQRERRAGGEYFFVHSPDEFLTLLDSLMYG